jgi:hypothetical protein
VNPCQRWRQRGPELWTFALEESRVAEESGAIYVQRFFESPAL